MPEFSPLLSASELQSLLESRQEIAVFDCSFDLMDKELGPECYLEDHLPGARLAHLEHDLTAQPGEARASGGRHPLPTREAFAERLGRWGLTPETTVVVYDRNGANYCGRLWWMLKWCGHDRVAILDGGWQGWLQVGGARAEGEEAPWTPTTYPLGGPLVRLATVEEVARNLGQGQVVIDSRAAARYRGEIEPLDPVAGHIPGALNRPFGDNLDASGHFKPAEQLRREFAELIGEAPSAPAIVHCGSGVSALPNVVAMSLAGLEPPALFAGSWSEWCSDPARPVAVG